MFFRSTRDNTGTELPFNKAIFQGLAPDGGLYVPVQPVDMRDLFLSFNENTSFVTIASEMVQALLPDLFDKKRADKIAEKAFPFVPKIAPLTEDVSILELFHGPSCAFKDFGASFLANSMEEFLEDASQKAVILTATSGDTGSAVARAFTGKKNIDVVILYPSGRVSPLQEKQLTTSGGNVIALEVEGNFDDCQRMVKEAFVDKTLTGKIMLTSANSINLGRLIPQSFYYAYAFAQLKHRINGNFYVCVPSGNFGNLTAGLYAWWWGLPVQKFIAATNENTVVPEYLETGKFNPRPSIKTYSNAMDVGNPSNFERLLDLFQNDHHKMGNIIHGETVTNQQTLDTMARIYKDNGMVIDPHTAVGVLASEWYMEEDSSDDSHIVTLSTAHPGKFQETVQKALSIDVELPDALKDVLNKEKKSVKVANTLEALSDFLLSRYG